MKRLILLLLVITLVATSLSSCGSEPDAYDLLCEFTAAYGVEGIVYSPIIPEGNAGYIGGGLVEKLYVFSGTFPQNYAIFINSRLSGFSECGVFVCNSSDAVDMVEEMCLERIRLLAGGENHTFIKISDMTVFYSTMQERERAEKIWREIIRQN